MTDSQKSSDSPPRRKHFWTRGSVLVLGLALLGLLAWFFVRETPSPPPSNKGETVPQAQVLSEPGASADGQVPSVSADANALLKNQLEQVIAAIRDANQKKDLSQLLSHYSANFPQLTQRAQSISKNWKIYDYPKMGFEIKEIKRLADDTALARVTWEVEAINLSTQKSKNISKTYLIRFVRESGQWRIIALDNAE
jgi:hypothetical protein